jgi:hypothetical protein
MSGLELVPNGSVRYIYSSFKVDDPIVGTNSDTQSSGVVDLGLALLLNDWFSIQPTVCGGGQAVVRHLRGVQLRETPQMSVIPTEQPHARRYRVTVTFPVIPGCSVQS